LKKFGVSSRHEQMKLCEIDKAVLAAHEAGRDWKTVRGTRSARRSGECSPAPTDATRPATELKSA
jgi:hypothetical protein